MAKWEGVRKVTARAKDWAGKHTEAVIFLAAMPFLLAGGILVKLFAPPIGRISALLHRRRKRQNPINPPGGEA